MIGPIRIDLQDAPYVGELPAPISSSSVVKSKNDVIGASAGGGRGRRGMRRGGGLRAQIRQFIGV